MPEPTTTLTPMQSFQEKLKDKLRDNIAELLPEDALAEMVQRVVNEEFFTKRVIPKPGRSSYSHETIEVPSQFQEMVVAATKPIIEEAVRQVLAKHADRIASEIDRIIDEGMFKMAVTRIDELLSYKIGGIGSHLMEEFKEKMQVQVTTGNGY